MEKWVLLVKLVCASKSTGRALAGTKNSFCRMCVFSVNRNIFSKFWHLVFLSVTIPPGFAGFPSCSVDSLVWAH